VRTRHASPLSTFALAKGSHVQSAATLNAIRIAVATIDATRTITTKYAA